MIEVFLSSSFPPIDKVSLRDIPPSVFLPPFPWDQRPPFIGFFAGVSSLLLSLPLSFCLCQ